MGPGAANLEAPSHGVVNICYNPIVGIPPVYFGSLGFEAQSENQLP
jgi:hypothetical protein